MKKLKQKIGILCALLGVMLVMASCGSLFEDLMGTGPSKDKYVQYSMDSIFLNKHAQEYIDMLGDSSVTVEDCEKDYYDGLKVEADYFMDYYDISGVSDETVERIVNMYDKIYAKSKYEVGSVVKNDTAHLVSVTIYPIDILQKANEYIDKFIDDFAAKSEAGEFDDLTDEEYEEIWADGIISLIEQRLDDIGYLDPETISVQVVETSTDFKIDDSDWERIDMLMISY